MTYKRVIINGEVYPGEDIKDVIFPSPTQPFWTVIYKDKTKAYTVDNIVVEVKE